nr:hypothetical protein CFP56_16738 [Quercus suber]
MWREVVGCVAPLFWYGSGRELGKGRRSKEQGDKVVERKFLGLLGVLGVGKSTRVDLRKFRIEKVVVSGDTVGSRGGVGDGDGGGGGDDGVDGKEHGYTRSLLSSSCTRGTDRFMFQRPCFQPTDSLDYQSTHIYVLSALARKFRLVPGTCAGVVASE